MNIRNKQILKTFTASRLLNNIQLKSSFYLSRFIKKPIHWGYPISASIEPTTACNLKCPECPSGLRQFTRPTGNLKSSTNKKILDSLGKQLQFVNYYFQGEPFINPTFLDFVKEARSRNIYVVTSTNAHFISETTAQDIILSGLSEIIISIDGTTQETYENYRKEGQLSKVLDGLTNLTHAKTHLKSQTPIVTLQFLVSKQNEHEINAIKEIKSKFGADILNLKTIQVYDYKNGNPLIPTNEKYSRYKQLADGTYVLKNKMSNHCWRMWSSCVVTWDETIVPCCFDKDAKHQLGNSSNQTFKTIWKSQKYNSMRPQILIDRSSIDICQNCSEGSKIWI